MRSSCWLLLFLLALLGSACAYRDACDEVEGYSFRSLDATPCGATTCHATISFADYHFSWRDGEQQQSGPYSCDDELLIGHPGADSRLVEGRYDGRHDLLIWEGREYRRP